MTYVFNKQKELKTAWPVETGTTAGTTKQTGQKYLHAETGSNVSKKDKIGLGD